MESKKRQYHLWVAVASREFMKIIHHLGLRSISKAAQELGINYRTLKKLDERHPDETITLEKVMEIWHALYVFATIIQSPDRAVEESLLIQDSLMQIMESFPLSEKLQEQVKNSCSGTMGHQPQVH